MLLQAHLILRSAHRAHLEGRTIEMQLLHLQFPHTLLPSSIGIVPFRAASELCARTKLTTVNVKASY
jgi:hypothetical protein